MPTRRTAMGVLAASGYSSWAGPPAPRQPSLIQGVVWQPSTQSVAPQGSWHRLGATRLLVQWTMVDGLSFLPGAGLRTVPRLPDWKNIAAQPWASEVILGLAGRFDDNAARQNAGELARMSKQLAQGTAGARSVLNAVGWYFPVEVEPTWADARKLAPLLSQLPRPLWISSYDNANVGPDEFASWLAGWLPRDVGVFFQDGVGLHTREPQVVLRYFTALVGRLGASRTRLIAEAFRPGATNQFRAATAAELMSQLTAYRDLPVYLFEGPQYVSDAVVAQVLAACGQAPGC